MSVHGKKKVISATQGMDSWAQKQTLLQPSHLGGEGREKNHLKCEQVLPKQNLCFLAYGPWLPRLFTKFSWIIKVCIERQSCLLLCDV